MKNRIIFFAFVLLLTSSAPLKAADGYVEISPAQPTENSDKIEVLEIFLYSCPHCHDFEPYIEQWLESKPDDVDFRRMPGVFRKNSIPHAKAYYTAGKLDVLDEIHEALFNAIHQQGRRIFGNKAIKAFFIERGVDQDRFSEVYESDEIDRKVKEAFIMAQRYKVTGVPAIIVNGKYMISSSTAGSFSNMLRITNQLVDKEKLSITDISLKQ